MNGAFGGLGNCPSFDDSCGTVFKITTGGVLTILHRFNGTDGAGPEAMLVRGPNGNFYGTTVFGGTACTEAGCGTVFEMTRDGTLTTLHSFDSMHGEHPNGLIHAPDGNFYGTTSDGGAGSGGTVFKMTPGGPVSTLYNFCSKNDCADGKFPGGSLVQSTDGNFYGTTQHGGNSVCSLGCGTVFKVTRNGTLMTLHTFDGSDGAYPNIGLVLATDGNLYGTTLYGGTGCAPYGCGTIFKITATGTLTTLHKFDNSDGSGPGSPLLQATNGTFYGTTEYGLNNSGTVFSLSVGLGPFVKTQPTFGKVGAKIVILGSNLRGATGVSFNGTPAPYKVLSDTVITTTVPIGATAGAIQITTPDGNLLSNLPFEVIR